MNNKDGNPEDYRSLLLLDEISKNNELTQRDLSRKLGVALGLVNSYIKNLASKGYITVSTIPKNRYKYYLTPRGFAEKTRLTYQHLQNFTNLYRVARKDFSTLFRKLENADVKRVVFCGVDEVTEIAYLSLKETSVELAGIFDDGSAGKRLLGYQVSRLSDINGADCDLVVITSFAGGEALKDALVTSGVSADKVCDISREGWLARIEGPQGE